MFTRGDACFEERMCAFFFYLFNFINYFDYQFLDRDLNRRLGCKPNGEGMEEIRRHPWFRSIDWMKLEAKELESPFVPDVSPVLIFLFVSYVLILISRRKLTLMRRMNWRSCF